ncbi:FxDxF family PEP-CTERM protein [Methylobacillus sp.]|uniref:FxDxF family PEP-CTERM protein n=1 Tax=Methylobacillus sp. TaxID=56818 RepID=UPI0012D1515F|nr:FxDxF family PEP-CTERM protein [Methylobacillus sp.]MPS48657.1 PEP-CTERM sorting domain-containing protein [Methylobacillus sp.]
MKAMNFKAILLAVSLIGASAGAYANPVVSGDLNVSPDAENYTFTHLTLIEGGGSINDWLKFTIDGDRPLFSASLSGTSSGSISFTAFNLYDAENGTLLSTGDVFAPIPQLSFGGLTGGVDGPATYWINIVGTYTGNATYNGNIAAAVPEPSTYGMLALGLGLIGFAARGRSKFSA